MMKKLYFNGKIHSMVSENDIFSVMVTEGEKITYTGDEIPNGNFYEKDVITATFLTAICHNTE